MKILLVEDDDRIALFIVKGLSQAGFVVDHACDGMEGRTLALSEPYDVAIIDIMLPKYDGLDLIRDMRSKGVRTPVIVLSAKRSLDDRVIGLEAGSDDYLVKPFAFSELLARIQALIRRSNATPEPTVMNVVDLSVDLLRHKVYRANSIIDLQPREFALLAYLMRNTGRVVSKTMIMEHVWEYNFDPQTNVVESRICRLRDKIDRLYDPKLIHTIRGVGYVLEERE